MALPRGALELTSLVGILRRLFVRAAGGNEEQMKRDLKFFPVCFERFCVELILCCVKSESPLSFYWQLYFLLQHVMIYILAYGTEILFSCYETGMTRTLAIERGDR